MKKKSFITSLVVALTLVGGATAFAASTATPAITPSDTKPVGTCLQLRGVVGEERTEAIDKAVKDGTITKERADFMKARTGKGMGRGMGGCSVPATPTTGT